MSETVRCARAGCGRRLTSPKSIAAGVGPVCARKLATQVEDIRERFGRVKFIVAATLIAEGGVRPIRGTREFRVTGRNGVYRTSATGCTCPAGKNNRDCYHLVAAKLLTA
jgi:uncharacterized Zn finger protein